MQNKNAKAHASQHRDNIKKALAAGKNAAVKTKEGRRKRDKHYLKARHAAAISNMPAEIFKWSAKDDGNHICFSQVCRVGTYLISCSELR